MKINIEVNIPDETLNLLTKDISPEHAKKYVTNILSQMLEKMLRELPELSLGIKTGVITDNELLNRGKIIGSNIADDEKRRIT